MVRELGSEISQKILPVNLAADSSHCHKGSQYRPPDSRIMQLRQRLEDAETVLSIGWGAYLKIETQTTSAGGQNKNIDIATRPGKLRYNQATLVGLRRTIETEAGK